MSQIKRTSVLILALSLISVINPSLIYVFTSFTMRDNELKIHIVAIDMQRNIHTTSYVKHEIALRCGRIKIPW